MKMKQIFELKENNDTIKNCRELFEQIIKFNIDFEQENFILICLNNKNKIIHKEVIFKGGLNNCTVDNRTLFRVALKYNSRSIIVAHNHPSNDLSPSELDIKGFNRIRRAGKVIGLTCLDSIIFNEKEFLSMYFYEKTVLHKTFK